MPWGERPGCAAGAAERWIGGHWRKKDGAGATSAAGMPRRMDGPWC